MYLWYRTIDTFLAFVDFFVKMLPKKLFNMYIDMQTERIKYFLGEVQSISYRKFLGIINSTSTIIIQCTWHGGIFIV